jgi:hypothetical protein
VLDQILTQFHAIPLEIKLPFTSTNPLLNRLDQLVEILEEGKDAKFAPLASKVKLLMKSIYSHGPYPIELPSKYDRQDGKIAMVVDDVLTEAECEEWIKEGERTGFVAALVNGQQSNERKSDRCFINSAERASALFQKFSQRI